MDTGFIDEVEAGAVRHGISGSHARVFTYLTNLIETNPSRVFAEGFNRLFRYFGNKDKRRDNDSNPLDVKEATKIVAQICKHGYAEGERLGVIAGIEEHHAALVRMFSLDSVDAKLLLVFLDAATNSVFSDFLTYTYPLSHREAIFAVASFAGLHSSAVSIRLSEMSPLVSKGLVAIKWSGDNLTGEDGRFNLPSALVRAISAPFAGEESLAALLLGQEVHGWLSAEDYFHVKEKFDLVSRLIKKGSGGTETGINIMLLGPPGAGKTEFAKTVADFSGVQLYAIGEKNEEGGEPGRDDRLSALAMANAVCNNRSGAALLFDEAEDVLKRKDAAEDGGGKGRGHSKAFINRMLEGNTVPVVWTSNSTHGIDHAVLRRMTVVIEFEPINMKVRKKIWNKYSSDSSGLTEDDVSALAKDWCVQPAIISNAARVAEMTGGGRAAAEMALNGHSVFVEKSRDDENSIDERFDPSLICGSKEIAIMESYLSRPGAKLNWSACFHGEPGTGKSEYARYIAKRINLPATMVRGSDILSAFVGETEKNIARVFSEAREKKSVLIIDEADSLIFSRKDAKYSWEVGQVEEFLICMERHPLPFIATTNLLERLDVASLRRFVFKPQFGLLSEAAAKLAFSRFFEFEPSRPLPPGLSLGDVANVAKRASFLGVGDEETIVSWLSEEVDLRDGKKEIGFLGKKSSQR